MNINFKKIIVHNFMSYGHAEYDLRGRNFCKVVGINECKEDNAASNGAGKSTLFNALCWVLTDKTSQGIDKNLKNLKVEENSCYVTLEFDVDKTPYVLTRTYKPSHYLKIVVDGVDQSGKGIKESEAVLAKYLPDLNTNLVSSMIILGQGLPNKFTANKPAERKEILEKLSKSDFMIEDIKDRINRRRSELLDKQREYEDIILSEETKKKTISEELEKANYRKANIKIDRDFDKELADVNENIIKVSDQLLKLSSEQLTKNEELQQKNKELQGISANKNAELQAENEDYNDFYRQYLEKKSEKDSDIKAKKKEIETIKNIKDVCPTCGQKLPHVHKQSTETQEAELVVMNEDLAKINAKYVEFSADHSKKLKELDDKYAANINQLNSEISQIRAAANTLATNINNLNSSKFNLLSQKSKIELDRSTLMKSLQELDDSIHSYEDRLKKLENELLYNNVEKQKILDAIQIDNKLNTLATRDFRGFLLKNTIDFISKSAKQYCKEIFKTDNIAFELDGNNIDISYCQKPIENLSGGERQKIDLIIQFALRDMMSQCLNFNCNIIVLDEILDNLDVVGSNEIINFISRKLNDVESIFIISHNINELEIPCDSQLTVVKNADGITSIR